MPANKPSVTISLTKGYVTIVSADDAERVMKHKWCVSERSPGNVRAVSRINGRVIALHRFILGEPEALIDHVSMDQLDNRRENLRAANKSLNAANRPKAQGKTGYKGVYPHAKTGRFTAKIALMRKQIHIGLFSDPTEAAKHYDMAAKALFGRFARTNFYGE